jgi:hypothetical protein
MPVVDLGFLTRRDIGLVAQHHDLVTADLLGQVRRHIPLQRGDTGSQAVLVAQPLMDCRLRHPELELGGDVLVVRSDLRPRRLPQPGVRQLREPAGHQRRPVRGGHCRPTGRQAGRYRRREVLTDRLAVHP